MTEGVQHFMAGEKHVTHTDFPSVAAYLDSAKPKTRQHATAEKTKCDVHLISPRELSHATKHINSCCKITILYECIYLYICIYTHIHIYMIDMHIYIACLDILYFFIIETILCDCNSCTI